MEDSRAARHDRCVFCVVVFGFGPFFRYVAPTVLRVSITVPARIAISPLALVVTCLAAPVSDTIRESAAFNPDPFTEAGLLMGTLVGMLIDIDDEPLAKVLVCTEVGTRGASVVSKTLGEVLAGADVGLVTGSGAEVGLLMRQVDGLPIA